MICHLRLHQALVRLLKLVHHVPRHCPHFLKLLAVCRLHHVIWMIQLMTFLLCLKFKSNLESILGVILNVKKFFKRPLQWLNSMNFWYVVQQMVFSLYSSFRLRNVLVLLLVKQLILVVKSSKFWILLLKEASLEFSKQRVKMPKTMPSNLKCHLAHGKYMFVNHCLVVCQLKSNPL